MPARIYSSDEADNNMQIDDVDSELGINCDDDDSANPPVKVQKRNTRERGRIGVINTTYQTLRKFFPPKKSGRRMSKLEILQRTINYIKDLTDSLDRGVPTSPTVLANADLPKRPRAKRSKGRKLLKDLMKENESQPDLGNNNHGITIAENSLFSNNSYQQGQLIDYPSSAVTQNSLIDVQPMPWQTQVEVGSSVNNSFPSCSHSTYQVLPQQQPVMGHPQNSVGGWSYPSSLHSPNGSESNSSYSYGTQNSFNSQNYHTRGHSASAPQQSDDSLHGIVDWIQTNNQSFDDIHFDSTPDYSWFDESSNIAPPPAQYSYC